MMMNAQWSNRLYPKWALGLGLLGTATVVLLAFAAVAGAAVSLTNASVQVDNSDGTFSRQAGAHPDFTTRFDVSYDSVTGLVDENVKDIRVDLPPGMVGNPTAVPYCPVPKLLITTGAECPPETQIGIALVGGSQEGRFVSPVYNMEHSPQSPGLFGFNFYGVGVFIHPEVRPSDYGVSSVSRQTSQAEAIFGADVTIWGVPADPVHNAQRYDRSDANRNIFDLFGCGCETNPLYPFGARTTAPIKPFLFAPTSCADMPVTFALTADSWQTPGVFDQHSFTADLQGTPFLTEGCDRLSFAPDIAVSPLSHVADAPTGLDVDLTVPQNDSPGGLATPHVRRVEVALPEGMSVSPSSAAGLGACSPAQIGLGTDSPVACPDSSRLGSVEIHTPLLDDRLEGDIFLAKQDDNPFRSLIALYMVANGPGFTVKLPGRVDLDPRTGRIVATFDNTPQVPFDELRVHFRGGSQAALGTPTQCGTYTTETKIVSWASAKPVTLKSPMVVDEGCDTRAFSPSIGGGTSNPAGGADSPFTFTITRGDRSQYLSKVGVTLPAGLLARIGSVPLCGAAQADAGSCGAESQIGRVAVLSGPGAEPLPVTGRVYLTGPYRGGPFGLSIVVTTAGQAGPFDLGNVVVRAAIQVDRDTAQASVQSDPLPSIIAGVPLRLRQARVTIDRPGFTFNPTSCAPKSIVAGLQSLEGASATLSVPFQALGCSELDLTPKLAIALTGKGQTTDDKHPGVHATVTQASGQSNLKKVAVSLPLSLALDPDNAQALCEFADGSKSDPVCPKGSIVGQATARTPILDQPLTGPVYFVKNVRKDPRSGREIRTLPKLVIPLTGQNGLRINLTGTSNVVDEHLVTTFDNIPDAPVSGFTLDIAGGKSGILVVSGTDICKASQVGDQLIDGQNRKQLESSVYLQTPACPLKIMSKKVGKTSVKIKVGGLGAGKVTVTGNGIKKTTKTIGLSTVATITAKRTKGKPGKVTVSFDPTGPAKAHKTTK